MDNFFNNGTKFWKLIVRVHIYHILILGMSNRLKSYNRLLGQVSDRVPGYSVEHLFCSV
jgi:hypothetical protein